MLKKSISLFLSFLMIIGVMTVLPIQTSAEGIDLSDTAVDTGTAQEDASCELADTGVGMDIASIGGMTLEQLKAKFPQNAYWNHKTQSGHGFVGSFTHVGPCNNPDGYSWSPCYSHSSNSIPVGQYDCNEFGGALQCAGFARKIAYDVYGSYYTNWQTGSIWDCKAGDVVTYGVTASNRYGHTLMIIARSGNTVTVGECNYGNRCKITWDRTMSIGAFDGGITRYVAPYALPSFEFEAPVLTSVESVSDGLIVHWNKIKNVPKYTVYYKTDPSQKWTALSTTVANGYRYTKAEYQKTYYFTVRCRNASGEIASDYDHNGISGTYRFVPKITAKAVKGKITLSWDKMPSAAKYRLFIKGGNLTIFTKLADTTNNSFNYTVGQNGVTYTFTVRCIDKNNNYISNYDSKGASAKFIGLVTLLATPTITNLRNTTKGIQLTWGAVKGAAKYCVFVKNGSAWKRICTTAALSYEYTGVKSGNAYTFTVRCISADGKKFTSACSAKGWTVNYIAAPRIAKLQSVTNGVKLTWSKINGAVRYRVFIKTKKGWAALGDATACSYVYKQAKSGTSYIFTVRCVSKDGKAYVSAYNTTGWKTKYQKAVDWSSMYYTFVKNNKNSIRWYDSTYKIYDNIPLALHDFDLNGVPELIIGYPGARLGLTVYTIYGGKVVYAGGIGGKATYYSDNAKYHGLFRNDSWLSGAEGGVYYAQLSKGKLVTTEVETFKYNMTTNKFETTILNKTLHSVSEGCMTTRYYNGYATREPKNGLKLYYWRDIQSKGWNSFIKYYGY